MRVKMTQGAEAHPSPYIQWWTAAGRSFRGGEWDRWVEEGEEVYFSILSHYWENQRKASTEVMKLQVGFEEESLPGEPNGSVGTAQQIVVDDEVSFTLNPRMDHDVFKLYASRGAVPT